MPNPYIVLILSKDVPPTTSSELPKKQTELPDHKRESSTPQEENIMCSKCTYNADNHNDLMQHMEVAHTAGRSGSGMIGSSPSTAEMMSMMTADGKMLGFDDANTMIVLPTAPEDCLTTPKKKPGRKSNVTSDKAGNIIRETVNIIFFLSSISNYIFHCICICI